MTTDGSNLPWNWDLESEAFRDIAPASQDYLFTLGIVNYEIRKNIRKQGLHRIHPSLAIEESQEKKPAPTESI